VSGKHIWAIATDANSNEITAVPMAFAKKWLADK
jgi:hypothetical protein